MVEHSATAAGAGRLYLDVPYAVAAERRARRLDVPIAINPVTLVDRRDHMTSADAASIDGHGQGRKSEPIQPNPCPVGTTVMTPICGPGTGR